MPASPRTHAFVEHLQGQIVHQATTGERGRTTTRAMQDLCNALADMFGLPPLPILQSSPVRSLSPMAAISTSQLHHEESHHSPSAPSIPLPDHTHQSQRQAPLNDPSPGTSKTLRIPSTDGACNKPIRSTSSKLDTTTQYHARPQSSQAHSQPHPRRPSRPCPARTQVLVRRQPAYVHQA